MANMQNGNSVKIPASSNNNNNCSSNNNNINNTTEVISSMIPDKDCHMHNGSSVDYSHSNGESVIVATNHEHVVHAMHDMDEMSQRNVERIARDWGVDNIDDVNAATAMLALKHGPKIFSDFQTG